MQERNLLAHSESTDSDVATVRIDTDAREQNEVNPYIWGKFCEHLGLNIYHGMEAQILFNPVFGEWNFRAGERRPSGGFVSENNHDKIERYVREHVRSLAYPESTDPDALLEAYHDGLAFGWLPTDADALRFSPDTGPSGNRAQRIEIGRAGEGVYQRTHLPAHRVREFEFRCKVRAADPTTASLSIAPTGGDPLSAASIDVDEDWQIVEGRIDLSDEEIDEDGIFEVALTTADPANLVVERVLLYPGDHVNYADPDIVEMLRESDLPLLRWPGGNFVSGYDWTDGVGPVDERPTRINPAWHGLEYNLFGTDEFIQFCAAVGCEPSICVNAGDGTPEEAAKWVEYCNGDPEKTEMGALRAEHGHPEPYDITYWEIGNELYGPWQVRWTTPAGNADRYERFREAMLEADPSIEVTATGQETNADTDWNDVLLEECGEDVRAISEHLLAGGTVDSTTDPDELYHAFMGYSGQLGEQLRDLRDRMEAAGIEDPKLDVTELQLFAHFQEDEDAGEAEELGRSEAGESEGKSDDGTLSPETMPTPATISEAVYDATIRHEFLRMGEFVELLTHSATVNHGGGLWKDGERVWANPCHYGRSMTAGLAGGEPARVELECDTISTENAFREIAPFDGVPAVDAFASVHEDGELVVVLANRRSADEPISVTLEVDAFDAAGEAAVETLSGETMYDENTRDDPKRIVPEPSSTSVENGTVELELPSYALTKLTIPSN
ncbi:alpha-L-arabinofuranosidase C-terminal domain-containing protein [Halosolutus gelatinilyticus]|uniref:alpha-L-arabinofuranosidase C-terminal domain-containing protein n=1 Tax=Halosolutus gelatinilyticus TaxID=2931975 RepID=UPI001FF0F81D|nr:alpha-L-arabinofuranosidase C-terminal domain-containing protein [Halosolutus gelatinilyticus]